MLEKIASVPLGILLFLGFPVTYILNVVDTWQGDSSVFLKLLINLTLDAILAGIWPITWLLWLVLHLSGQETPISTVLGF